MTDRLYVTVHHLKACSCIRQASGEIRSNPAVVFTTFGNLWILTNHHTFKDSDQGLPFRPRLSYCFFVSMSIHPGPDFE
jgi:hypothetical protein